MKIKIITPLLFLTLFSISQVIKAQATFSFIPGVYYNGKLLNDQISGFGLIAGLEYKPRANHFFSLELRTRYGMYSFDDGTNWTWDNEGNVVLPENLGKARMEYKLFSPQAGIVPRFHLYLDDVFSIYLENEFSLGLMTGNFKYGGEPYTEKKITESIFNYNINAGVEYNTEKNWSFLASIGYSTLNFRSKIRKHQPKGYQGWIPNQDALIMINVLFKIHLGKNRL